MEGYKGSWEALKNKLILTEFFSIKLQVTNKAACCGCGKKIKPVKLLTSHNIPVHLNIAAFLLRYDNHWNFVENTGILNLQDNRHPVREN